MPKPIQWLMLGADMAVDLAGFLWRKYNERFQAYSRMRRAYLRTQFAEEIGINEKTLGAIMNGEGTNRLAVDNYRLFVKFFGDEFTREFDLQPGEELGWDKTQPKG